MEHMAGFWDDGASPKAALAVLPDDLQALLLAWSAAPTAHPILGDWRQVGYRRGARDPQWPDSPERPHQVARTLDAGVFPDRGDEVSGPLQRLLDDVGRAGGGVVQLEAGRYMLDQPLFIRSSNVVLVGAGRHETTLHFTRPLAETIFPTHHWSWHGGQVYIAAPERVAESAHQGWDWNQNEGWLGDDVLATVAPAPRGALTLPVEDSSRLAPGAMVVLRIADSGDHRLMREMAGNGPGARDYPWSSTWLDAVTWSWPVRIVAVPSARTVTLEQPLRVTIPDGVVAELVELGPTVHDSGVESLTIENRLLPQTKHNVNPGSNGVCFHAVHDCWARDVHVVNADVAFSMTHAKSCTLSGISAGGRSLHHFTITRASSHDNLIEDFELEEFTVPAAPGSYLHGISVELLSSGNVWRRGSMRTGTFDSHRALPFENLRTDIRIVNKDGVPGGSFEAGPQFGARWAHWGISVLNGERLGIDITDVAPCSITAGITGLDRTRLASHRRSGELVLPGRSRFRDAGLRRRSGCGPGPARPPAAPRALALITDRRQG